MLVHLVIGDWSDDGHGKTDSVFIESNLTALQIEEAYSQFFTNNLELALYKDFCEDYDDVRLPEKLATFLLEAGLIMQGYIDTENFIVNQDEYVQIYLFIVKLARPDFKYSLIEIPKCNIGGYGFFN